MLQLFQLTQELLVDHGLYHIPTNFAGRGRSHSPSHHLTVVVLLLLIGHKGGLEYICWDCSNRREALAWELSLYMYEEAATRNQT